MAETCRVRPLRPADLAQVLVWRNSLPVRRVMFSQHEITPEEHQRWFDRAGADPRRRLLIAETSHQQLGFVHFSGVAPGATADWGFYAAPDAAKGSGRQLGQAALDHAFQRLGLAKVRGQALAFNTASIRLHLALAFEQAQVQSAHQQIEGLRHDLITFVRPAP